MKCHNHPDREAERACVGCGKFFCADCVTEIHGKSYCKPCLEELFDKKDKDIEKAENKQPNVYMNAGGASSSSSSSSSAASSSGGRTVKPPYPKNSLILHILLLFFTAGIGNVVYYLYVKNKQREWERYYR